jgi:hypothetical protein
MVQHAVSREKSHSAGSGSNEKDSVLYISDIKHGARLYPANYGF